MNSDDLIAQVGPRIREKANLIWNVANSLAGPFKPHERALADKLRALFGSGGKEDRR